MAIEMQHNTVISISQVGKRIAGRIKKFGSQATKWITRTFKKKHHPSHLEPPPPPPPPSSVAPPPPEVSILIQGSSHPSLDELSSSPATPAIQLPDDDDDDVVVVPANPVIAAQHRKPIQTITLHPITLIIRGQELGKSILNLGTPLTIALLINNNGKSDTIIGHVVLTGLSAGCIAIWNGILLRDTFSQAANFIEQAGIVTVLISFNLLVASALPKEFAWVPILCGGLCLPTFVVAVLPHQSTNENTADHVSTCAVAALPPGNVIEKAQPMESN